MRNEMRNEMCMSALCGKTIKLNSQLVKEAITVERYITEVRGLVAMLPWSAWEKRMRIENLALLPLNGGVK